MTKQELIADISKKTGIDKKEIEKTVESFMEVVRQHDPKQEHLSSGLWYFSGKKTGKESGKKYFEKYHSNNS